VVAWLLKEKFVCKFKYQEVRRFYRSVEDTIDKYILTPTYVCNFNEIEISTSKNQALF